MNLILVGGIPTSGKTTFARTLGRCMNSHVVETDLVYYGIANEIGFTEYREYPNPKHWLNTDQEILNEWKQKKYKLAIAPLMPLDPDFGNWSIIVEGYGVDFNEDRKIIIDILNPDEILFFNVGVSFDLWARRRAKEVNDGSWAEYNQLNRWRQMPSIDAPLHPIKVYNVSNP